MTSTGRLAPTSNETLLVASGLFAYLIFSIVVSLTSSGTYDAGDSVMHYQFAHYAFQHPGNLLVHWAKPFYTLLAAPFASVGFWGIKLFQCLLALGTGWFTYQSARQLGFKSAWLAPILVLAAPEFFLSQLSGLTEPLFAFVLILGVFALLKDKTIFASILLSMLPFVRTEGFLVLPAFALFLIWQREWKALPFLALGTAVYAVLGGIFMGDFLWIWNNNPYAGETIIYGLGQWLHFPEKYLYIVGIPIYILTLLGFAVLPIRMIFNRMSKPLAEILLIFGPFCIYFGSHVYFWVSGTGHSMGLLRVMIAILPLGALIAHTGMMQLLAWIPRSVSKIRTAILGLATIYVLVFPAMPNHASIRPKELRLSMDQNLLQETATFLQKKGMLTRKIYSEHPSAAFFFGIDPFDPEKFSSLNRLKDEQPAAGCLIVVDTWFASVESGFDRAFFDARPTEFQLLHSVEGQDANTKNGIYVYEKI
jgi:Gpi18-like mannosyltransferase